MQVFDISIAPGASRQIDVQADYIYFLTGSAGGMDTTIAFRPESGGETVYLKPGQAYKLSRNERMGTRWSMLNLKGEATIVGQVLMGQGEFFDNRISGSVEVVDGGKARTIAGTTFMQCIAVGPVAGQLAFAELWNPAGSNRRLVVKSVFAATGTSGTNGIVLSYATQALATLIANCQAKRPGAATSIAQARSTNSASTAVVAGQSLYREPGPNGVKLGRVFDEPLIIDPGYGLLVYTDDMGASLQANVEFIEELIA